MPGGEVGARAARLTIVCGGDGAVCNRVLPLLQSIGKSITLVGGNRDGQTTKVANQIIVALNIAAGGAAWMGGLARSRVLDVRERWTKRTFNLGSRIRLHRKDLSLALQGARKIGMASPQTAPAAQLMRARAANGLADHPVAEE